LINFSLGKLRSLDATETGRVKSSDNSVTKSMASLAMGRWGMFPPSLGNFMHSAAAASLTVKFRKLPKKNMYYIFVHFARDTLKLT